MNTARPIKRSAFTLIEMLGVIIIIGLLAATILPKVIRAVARGKISNTVLAYDTLKSALVDYYAKFGNIPIRSGTGTADTATATGRFDADLFTAGFIEKLIQTPIGNLQTSGPLNTRVHVKSVTAVLTGAVAPPTATAGGNNYDLDGNPATADFTQGQVVASLVIPGVPLQQAVDLNAIVDGDNNTGSGADTVGLCIYSAPSNGTVTVYLYVGHR